MGSSFLSAFETPGSAWEWWRRIVLQEPDSGASARLRPAWSPYALTISSVSRGSDRLADGEFGTGSGLERAPFLVVSCDASAPCFSAWSSDSSPLVGTLGTAGGGCFGAAGRRDRRIATIPVRMRPRRWCGMT
jgi:hypothetical protein